MPLIAPSEIVEPLLNARIAVSHEDRSTFRDTVAPLPGWRIWIGFYHRFRWYGHWVQACIPIHSNGDIVIPNVQDRTVPLANTQWTTIVVGKLYIHTACSSTAEDLNSRLVLAQRAACQEHPRANLASEREFRGLANAKPHRQGCARVRQRPLPSDPPIGENETL